MIEKVARAIDGNYPHGLNCSVPNCPSCAHANKETEDQAKAAIEAMREPTEEMYNAYRCDELWCDLNSKKVWQLWIDAALKETK